MSDKAKKDELFDDTPPQPTVFDQKQLPWMDRGDAYARILQELIENRSFEARMPNRFDISLSIMRRGFFDPPPSVGGPPIMGTLLDDPMTSRVAGYLTGKPCVRRPVDPTPRPGQWHRLVDPNGNVQDLWKVGAAVAAPGMSPGIAMQFIPESHRDLTFKPGEDTRSIARTVRIPTASVIWFHPLVWFRIAPDSPDVGAGALAMFGSDEKTPDEGK